jgi:hypothetical protein
LLVGRQQRRHFLAQCRVVPAGAGEKGFALARLPCLREVVERFDPLPSLGRHHV